MDPRFEHIDDVIARFLAGEAGADDLRLLEAWKASDPANAREFAQLERIFSESASLREVLPVNTDKAWGEVHARLGGGKVIPSVLTSSPLLHCVSQPWCCSCSDLAC